MDNTISIDLALGAVLLAGALIGAKRGLVKSLMGLLASLLAMVGAAILCNTLTPPVTDLIAPKVEDAVVEAFAKELDILFEAAEPDAQRPLPELFEEYGLSEETLKGFLASLASGALGEAAKAREKAVDACRAAVGATVRAAVERTVHAALMLVSYPVLLIAVRLLTRTLDHVFDLPVLNEVNTALGAALGLLTAALALYVVLFAASRLGWDALNERKDGSLLLSFFMDHSPVEWMSFWRAPGLADAAQYAGRAGFLSH